MMKKYLVFLMVLLLAQVGKAQDIEALLNAPILTANGGISINQIATFTPGDSTATTDPYALFIGGNLNLSFFGVANVPLSFAYTNQQLSKNASLPFNRFSFSPSYKWVKTYIGYTSMQFSPYSLAGHELFGGGVELTPSDKWTVSALYGRLQKASSGEEGVNPAYERMGGGFKLGYKGAQYDVAVNLFKAKDQLASVQFTNPDSISVKPQDNLTGSIETNIQLIPHVNLSAEYGMSALNRNIIEADRMFYHAFKTRLAYSIDLGSVGATYERVAPNYTTLGAYYMTNDYENITANVSTTINKINIAMDGGYQRDNLDNQKTNATSRMIYSGNISANVSEKLSLGANFSNLQSYMYINDVYSQVTQTNPFQNLDTLNVTQLNYTVGLNAAYTLQSSETQRQSTNVNFMYQKTAEAQQYSQFTGNGIYNATVAYQFSLTPAKLNTSASVSYNYNSMPDNLYTKALTYNLSVQKTFLEDVRTSLTTTYSDMDNQEGSVSNVLNLRLSAGYTLLKKHNFNLSLSTLYSEAMQKTRLQYAAHLTYSYAFNMTLSRKEKRLHLDTQF
ncbi:hypothetical protein FACS1894162_8520 [Bacteroidia bacterium]|nr:hypothetical protein FACS1894162_8520 [Bacteroidia bacterium]